MTQNAPLILDNTSRDAAIRRARQTIDYPLGQTDAALIEAAQVLVTWSRDWTDHQRADLVLEALEQRVQEMALAEMRRRQEARATREKMARFWGNMAGLAVLLFAGWSLGRALGMTLIYFRGL